MLRRGLTRSLSSRTVILPMLGAIGFALFVAVAFKPSIEGDGVGYYSYLHAVLVSHNLTFVDEYRAAISSGTPLYMPLVTTHTSTGQLADFFPVGSAILAAPAYVVTLLFRPSGEPQYGPPFVQAFALSSLLYLFLALAVSYRLTAAVTASRASALIGLSATFFATPVLYYGLSDPSYSHAFSVFCCTVFVYVWWKGPPSGALRWFGLGLLGGLMAMTRFQDGLLMALVLIDAKRLRWPALMLVPGAVLGFAPQLVVDHLQFGTWWPARPPGQDLDPTHAHYLATLFSSGDGLLVWTPAAILAGVGFLYARDRRLILAAVIAFVLEFVIVSWAPDTAGRAFGSRRFLDLFPFAVVGFATFVSRFPRFGWLPLAALSAWNLVLEANFEYVMNSSSPVSYLALLKGQESALSFVPRLFVKGAVVRDLVFWRQLHSHFNPVGGFAVLAAELTCGLAAAAVAFSQNLRRPATFAS